MSERDIWSRGQLVQGTSGTAGPLTTGSQTNGRTATVTCMWGEPSLVPRPPPQLLSLAVRKSRRPGRVSHVMRAAAYVTDSVNIYSQYSTGYRLFQRRYRDQTNSRGEAGPTYTTYLDLKQNR